MMEPVSTYAKEQYGLVRESRAVLFEYCRKMAPEDFLEQNSSFGRGGSIRNLLTHIANTYEYWIGKQGLKKDLAFTTYDSIQNIDDAVTLFYSIDKLVAAFIDLHDKPDTAISYEIGAVRKSTSRFKLFTHVITHEFHHKGQILSLSRHLGYIPVDTDILR